jgi:putative membrane protein
MTWVWTSLLIAGIALLAYTLARVLAGGLVPGPGGPAVRDRSGRDQAEDNSPGEGSRARRILDERYAAGELSTQEYEHRRPVLTGREEKS